jgi:hypothetical protein
MCWLKEAQGWKEYNTVLGQKGLGKFGLHMNNIMCAQRMRKVEEETLECPLLWCCGVMCSAEASIVLLKGLPLDVHFGEEAKVATGGVVGSKEIENRKWGPNNGRQFVCSKQEEAMRKRAKPSKMINSEGGESNLFGV